MIHYYRGTSTVAKIEEAILNHRDIKGLGGNVGNSTASGAAYITQ
jgi:hypothetical protein